MANKFKAIKTLEDKLLPLTDLDTPLTISYFASHYENLYR